MNFNIRISNAGPLCLLAGLFCHGAQAAPAQGAMPEVVVSANRVAVPSEQVGSAVVVITRAQIEASGAANVTEVLRGEGGVQISDLYGDGSRPTVSMRGFGANAQANSLILVDGRRLNNTDLAAPDLNSININNVERIEIVQGSAGVLYGDQAVGGVINIITRRPTHLQAQLKIGGGSYGSDNESLFVGNRLANGLSYQFSGQRRQSSNYRDHNHQTYSNGLGRIGYEWKTGSAFVEYQRVEERLQTPGALFADQVAADRRQTRFHNDFGDTTTENARIALDQSLGNHWRFLSEFSNRYVDAHGILNNTAFTQLRHHQELTPRLVGTYDLNGGRMIVTAGTDLTQTRYRLTSPFGSTDDRQDMESLYFQGSLPLGSVVTLTGGLRRALAHDDLTDAFAFPAGVSLGNSATAATVGLAFAVAPGTKLFLRRDDNFRFPLADEQTFATPGLVGLRTQTGTSNEFGLTWRRGVDSAEIVGYQLRLKNEIDFNPAVGFFGANTNLDPTDRTGAIVQGRYQVLPSVILGARYGYVDARFSNGVFSGNRIPFVAENELSVNAEYRFLPRWSAYAEMQAIGERVAQGDYANAEARLPGYAVFNAKLDYHWSGLTFTARVNNLLDKRYSDSAATAFNPATFANETGYYPAPERNFMVTLAYLYE
jgi:iron complex outermembrane receptor protein